jgi:hypothetical protein
MNSAGQAAQPINLNQQPPASSDHSRRAVRPVSHHQGLPRGLSPHHHMSASPQNHPAAPHLAELANYDRKRRVEHQQNSGRAAGEHRRDRSRGGAQPASSAAAATAGHQLARVNASVSTSSPMRKISEPVLINGAANNSRPEVNNTLNVLWWVYNGDKFTPFAFAIGFEHFRPFILKNCQLIKCSTCFQAKKFLQLNF